MNDNEASKVSLGSHGPHPWMPSFHGERRPSGPTLVFEMNVGSGDEGSVNLVGGGTVFRTDGLPYDYEAALDTLAERFARRLHDVLMPDTDGGAADDHESGQV